MIKITVTTEQAFEILKESGINPTLENIEKYFKKVKDGFWERSEKFF